MMECKECESHYEGICWKCKRKRRKQIWDSMTSEQKQYDRYVDPLNAYHTEFAPGCSCHINPPCSFCTRETKEVE